MLKKIAFYVIGIAGLILFLLTVAATEGGSPLVIVFLPLLLAVAVIISKFNLEDI